MSKCENCPSNKNCKYHGSSQLYKKDGTPLLSPCLDSQTQASPLFLI